jgi:hypothetical protein
MGGTIPKIRKTCGSDQVWKLLPCLARGPVEWRPTAFVLRRMRSECFAADPERRTWISIERP